MMLRLVDDHFRWYDYHDLDVVDCGLMNGDDVTMKMRMKIQAVIYLCKGTLPSLDYVMIYILYSRFIDD